MLDLGGTWKFHFAPSPSDAPAGAHAVDFDDSAWDELELPCHWVLKGDCTYGRPAYTNVNYPFPIDVPHVPDENPTGDHRLRFTVDEAFLADGARAFLRFLGVESLCIAHLNGQPVGIVRGSRLMQELDVTEQLNVGENLLHLRVHQWSAHSYLEDQDQWWLPGVFRDVQLHSRPAGGIDDVWLRADFDPATGQGSIHPEIRCSEFPVTVSIPEIGIEHKIHSLDEIAPFEVGLVEPWSAESPRLYAVTVSNAVETLQLRCGFRRVEILGDQWRVNGTKLRIRGVNRHEFDPDEGRVFHRDRARAGLELMKRHNINAIRTAHYPPHPDLLDLTDELGFWVIDECDLETHGFEFEHWVDNPTDDPRWREALLDRVERFFERDKNHPSVICWSLGNESHTGANLAAMAAFLHRRDPSRPVHYEGDFDGAYTDIVSRMYATPEELKAMSEGRYDFRVQPGRMAALATRPMMLCEYAHAMGNGPGGLDYYDELFDELPQWHGGFIWEWRDHGLRTTTADGQTYFAYGGDFGEPIHDSSFVCDGLVLSDGTASPALSETKAVFAPVKMSFETGGVRITNMGSPDSFAKLRFTVIDEADGVEISRSELAAEPDRLLELPEAPESWDGNELWRTVEASLREDCSWAQAGHVVSSAQHLIAQRPPARLIVGNQPVVTDGDVIIVGPARLDARTGDLTSLHGYTVDGPRLELWRAPTENDSLSSFGSYLDADPLSTVGMGAPGPSTAQRWRDLGLHRMQRRVIAVDVASHSVAIRHRYAAAARRRYVDVTIRYQASGDAVRIEADAAPSSGWPEVWGRLGLHFAIKEIIDSVEWFGTGPDENYPDSCTAARVGRFERSAEQMVTPYAVPQESGHRSELRSLLLNPLGLQFDTAPAAGKRPGFSIRAHDVAEVAAAAHPHELPESRAWHLYLDVAQHGLGSRSCGPDTRPEYQLRPQAGAWDLEISRQ